MLHSPLATFLLVAALLLGLAGGTLLLAAAAVWVLALLMEIAARSGPAPSDLPVHRGEDDIPPP